MSTTSSRPAALSLAIALLAVHCGGDPASGPPVDAHAVADADPAALTLTRVVPQVVDEGRGSGGGRPVAFLIHATGLVDDGATVRALVGGTDVAVQSVVASAGGTIAVAVAVPELESLHAGEVDPHGLTLEVTQGGGAVVRTIDVAVTGHDALVLDGTPAVYDLDDAADLLVIESVYSSIHVTGDTTVIGRSPAGMIATGAFSLDARLSVRAGGCRRTDDCRIGGGGPAGAVNNGGGGGGFGTMGTRGAGPLGGLPGVVVGNPMLMPLFGPQGEASEHHGYPGGEGDATNVGVLPGGEGGGAMLLTVGGAIMVGAGGRLDADGASPVAGFPNTSGGGGSGGALLLRAGAPIVQAGPWVSARGAVGGSGGGTGGAGRVRIDVPGGALAGTTVADGPAAIPGPSWDAGTPVIVRGSPTVTLTARAADGCLAILPAAQLVAAPDDGCGAADRHVRPTGTPIQIDLRPDVNRICLGWTRSSMLDDTQLGSTSCVDIAYVP